MDKTAQINLNRLYFNFSGTNSIPKEISSAGIGEQITISSRTILLGLECMIKDHYSWQKNGL